MKQIVILIVFLSCLSVTLLTKSPTAVISAKTLVKNDASQAVSITWTEGQIAVGDILSFTTDGTLTAINDKIKFSVPSNPPNILVNEAKFETAGVYNIFLRASSEDEGNAQLQTNAKQAVCEVAISETTISTVTSIDVRVGTDTPVVFTLLAPKTLYDGDKIIFSISDGPQPSTEIGNTVEISLKNVVFTEKTIEQTVNFGKEGTYKMWVERDAGPIIQTDRTLKVNPIPTTGTVTKAKTAFKGNSASVSIDYFPDGIIVKDNSILFTLTDTAPPSDNLKITAQKNPTTPTLTGNVNLDSGLYYLWVKVGAIDAVKQNVKQRVFEAELGVGTISSVSLIDVNLNTDSTVEFTLAAAKTLYNEDKIILSITNGNLPPTEANDKVVITLKDVFDSSKIVETVKFTKKGTYKMWVERDAGPIKQDVTLEVNRSSFPNETTVTSAKTVVKVVDAGVNAAVDVSIGYSPNDAIIQDDLILFSLEDPLPNAETLNITVTPTPASLLTGNVTFSTSGLYNLWVKAGARDPVKQTVKQAVMEEEFNAKTISKTEATDVKVDIDAIVKLTVPAKTLYDGDFIIYSISTEDAADKNEVKLENVDFTATEISQTVKFTKAGTYNIWIKRDTVTTKQTDQKVVVVAVVSGSYIAMSLALLLGIFIL